MAPAENLILKAIRHACVASACRQWSVKDERTERGLTRVANQHSVLAGAALTEWAEGIERLAPLFPAEMDYPDWFE